MTSPSYNRVLIKLSGERFAGDTTSVVLNVDEIQQLADEVLAVQAAGMQTSVTVGGGNILRGKEAAGMGIEEAQAHYMGMLAIMFNALALQSILEEKGAETRVLSGIHMHNVAEPFIRRRAVRHLEKGRIVIFGPSGIPFMTSDTAGALRAIEIGADLYVKATKVAGIFDKDPVKHDDAEHIEQVTYRDILKRDLEVMDGSAIALCKDNKLPLMVCKIGDGTLLKAIQGKAQHTLVTA